jgi:hypothetical protein
MNVEYEYMYVYVHLHTCSEPVKFIEASIV